MPINSSAEAIEWLRTPAAIRARCTAVYDWVAAGRSAHFTIEDDKIPAAAAYVADTIRRNYADLNVPFHSRWRHFAVGGIDRWHMLADRAGGANARETARVGFDLALTSVLLDAGAGPSWRYRETEDGPGYSRSEGLAVASLNYFASGAMSDDAACPLRADAAALAGIETASLADAFQSRPDNPLVGVAGRAAVLRNLGTALSAAPDIFGASRPRVGNLFDYLSGRAGSAGIAAGDILAAVLRALAPIWPARLALDGVNLGDVWRHPAAAAGDPTDGLVPFHKLSQWLTYSLVEPLEAAGIPVHGLDALTGLAEYRNGGLFIDLGVLGVRDPSLADTPLPVDAEAVVEWRALTIALLDRIAGPVRDVLGVTADAMPLLRLLEGGTWSAGRRIARERRPDGGPPLQIISDGTVF